MESRRLAWSILLLLSLALRAHNEVALTTLFSFGANDASRSLYGALPQTLVQGTDGNFYGTTSDHGADRNGTVFVMTPNGRLSTLAAIPENSGSANTLTQGKDGNFYGTTSGGGLFHSGTVFMVTTNGIFNTWASFDGNNGHGPFGRILEGSDGYFYGTTINGGSVILNNGSVLRLDYGTVFKATYNRITLVHLFDPFTEGAWPGGGLTLGKDGYFYGVTRGGGGNNTGTVFRVSTIGSFATLYSFSGRTDGANPIGGLIQGTDGYFYGTTSAGSIGNGTVFRIDASGKFGTLLSFNGVDGAFPVRRLVQAQDGRLYGTTANGGNGYTGAPLSGAGTVFQLTGTTLTTIVSFKWDDGAYPAADLIQGSDGSFYGTTSSGGIYGGGTIFKLSFTPLPQAVADFAANPTSGAAPLIVQFTDRSTGTITARDWNFGDGSPDTSAQNPSHTYTNAGTYTVTLKVAGSGGATSRSRILTVSAPPTPPTFRAVTAKGTAITLTWSTVPSKTYQIQYRNDLAKTIWTNISGVITASNLSTTIVDSTGVGRGSEGFYRVVLVS
ncbi:MAG: hypothetical protein DMF60_18545 [Acidobacteria bacterium]|nr:MAG: hypothetical protein DMF60_18545 [Acidobacteriota bacterium]